MTKDSERFAQINALLERALEQPLEQREDFVRDASAGDPELLDEVLTLLAFDVEESGGLGRALGCAFDALEDPVAAQPGSMIGSWRILRKIAEGGMGMVYLAERVDADFQQLAAIKLLPRHRVDAHSNARFAEERRILASLQHPHIARLIDGGRLDDGLSYLVMEYVDGINIERYCREHALDNGAILRLVLKVCGAVQFAHSKLVVHRDIKPSNILVTAQGEPVLLDFGIAKLLDADGEHPSPATRTDLRRFTPLFASPEQVEGGEITTAVDVYALGLLLFLLLAGRLPYVDTGSHPRELEQQIVSGPKLPPSEAVISRDAKTDGRTPQWIQRQRRALRGDLDTVLMMALRTEPERRYPSVTAFADDLQRTLTHSPILARADSWSYRLRRLLRRHPVALPLSVLSLVAVLVGSSVFSLLLANQRDEALQLQLRATTAAEFSASLLSRTAASQDTASTLSVRELLDSAALRVGSELADEPLVAVQMHLALADSYVSWGHYEDAIAQAERALSLAEAGAGEREQARALDLLSVGHHDLRQLETSLAYSRRAQALWERIGTPAEQGNALSNIALGLNSLRRRDEAAVMFQQALEQLRKAHAGDHKDIAWVLNNLAWSLQTLGDMDQARMHYEQAVAMQQRLGDSLLDLAMTRHNLAGLYFDEGNIDSAERLWLQSRSEFQSVYGSEGHAAVARAHLVLGMLARARGDIDIALERNGEALRINQALLGESHPWTARSMYKLALAQRDHGELDASEALQRRVLAAYESAESVSPSELASVHLALGSLARTRGEHALAESKLRHAQALLGRLSSPDRTPINAIELELGRTIALQGRREEGRAMAESALQRLRDERPSDDWRRLAAEVQLELPPFVEQPGEQARARAQAVIELLHQQVGPNEPNSRRLAQALAGSPD